MAAPPFQIVHECDDLLVINKEPGLVCHPTKGDAYSSLIGRIRLYLGDQGTPHLVHRLDRETSGLVLVAKHREAARALGLALQARQTQKTYLGIVHGQPMPGEHLVEAPTGKDVHSAVAIKDGVRPDGAPAQTRFTVCVSWGWRGAPYSLLRIRPMTGRKHQIRIHLAHVGYPLVGDKIYGGDERLYLDFVVGRLSAKQREALILEHHALHAWRLAFDWNGTRHQLRASLPPAFRAFCGPALEQVESELRSE